MCLADSYTPPSTSPWIVSLYIGKLWDDERYLLAHGLKLEAGGGIG